MEDDEADGSGQDMTGRIQKKGMGLVVVAVDGEGDEQKGRERGRRVLSGMNRSRVD